MTKPSAIDFDRQYQTHIKHLKLKGLQPKTIEAYSRAIRRIGNHFDHRIDDLTEPQLTDYFTELLSTHSWSAVKLDLYGLKFYYQHVLNKPWVAPGLIKPPKSQRLPDISNVPIRFTDGQAKVFEALWSFKGEDTAADRIMQRAGLGSDKPSDLFKIKEKDRGKPVPALQHAAYRALVVTQQRAGLYAMPCAEAGKEVSMT